MVPPLGSAMALPRADFFSWERSTSMQLWGR